MKNTNFILLAGKSGSGKTTVCKELYKKYGLAQINSYTTRPPRHKGEIGHTFVNQNAMDYILENEEIIGYTEYNGYQYCATTEQMEETDIYVIDADGIRWFEEQYTGHKPTKVVYLNPPHEERMNRLISRDGEEKAMEREQNDTLMFDGIEELADYVIEASDLDTVVEQVYKIYCGKNP